MRFLTTETQRHRENKESKKTRRFRPSLTNAISNHRDTEAQRKQKELYKAGPQPKFIQPGIMDGLLTAESAENAEKADRTRSTLCALRALCG
jgi:hypothetical protein